MKRGANADFFLKLLERIRATIPNVAIRTSMIVGFPGETQAEFEELCQFVQAAQFDRLGVFAYSDQETSASFHLDNKVDKRTIYNRRRSLMALQRRISLKRNRALIGREFPVLIEGISKETELLWEARLSTQAPEIDGVCYINDFGADEKEPRPGEMRKVRITEAHDYDLVGELVDSAETAFGGQAPATLTPFPIYSQSSSRTGAIPVR
jgi:ribosomal protein S12 methylthiotransferase